MTLGDLILGILVALGFFVSAAVSRVFRGRMAGIFIGGVVGLAVSVFILVYGLTDVFAVAPVAVEN
ncbi:hypothetical protein [Yoonia sp.]|uniref:hypothetical protein n=1 Tax=Yoonia sp. TaxID=2212373 RepID=UPI002E06BD7A|nr:hypothetical protein [Yoonia sp.]